MNPPDQPRQRPPRNLLRLIGSAIGLALNLYLLTLEIRHDLVDGVRHHHVRHVRRHALFRARQAQTAAPLALTGGDSLAYIAASRAEERSSARICFR